MIFTTETQRHGENRGVPFAPQREWDQRKLAADERGFVQTRIGGTPCQLGSEGRSFFVFSFGF